MSVELVDMVNIFSWGFFCFKHKTAYEMLRSLVGSEMCIRDSNEGCLSVPGIHEDVLRKKTIKIRYFDENWVEHTKTFTGIVARVIQHEYDHLEGKVFTDHLSPMRKLLLKGKLNDCLLYTSDAADELLCVDLGGRRIINKNDILLTNNFMTLSQYLYACGITLHYI